MNEKELAYAESVITELSEMIDLCFKKIIDDKKFETPNFDEVLKRKKLSQSQAELIVSVFSDPYNELHDLDQGDDKKLNEKYEWLSTRKRKKLISVLEALVMSCLSEYTELQPEFQELKENIRKISENEKEKAHQKKQ